MQSLAVACSALRRYTGNGTFLLRLYFAQHPALQPQARQAS
jgi:hypothetical protein